MVSEVTDMAGSLQLRSPEAFNFKKPDEWLKWLKRFEQFRIASGLSTESQTRQVSTLLYCMGDEAEDILISTNISSDDKKSYEKVLEKFNDYFKVRKNVRARFNRRNQLKGEPAEQYITELYRLVETCEYGELTPEMIRDRLVIGIQDSRLSERLQMDPELTLEKAKKLIRQSEAVHEHQVILQQTGNADKSATVEQIRHKTSRRTNHPQARNTQNQQQSKCKRCGNKPHALNKCPARDSTCHKCKRKGHYSNQCFSKTVNDVTTEQLEENLDVTYLSAIVSEKDSCWTVNIEINGKPVIFKLDTGAEVTAITQSTLTKIGNFKLGPVTKSLCGPDRKPLSVIGRLNATLASTNHKCNHEVYVIKQLKHNLLGLPAIKELQLLAQIDHISLNHSSIINQFSKLFTGLGTFKKDFEITIKPDAKPFAIHTPRKVPLPLRQKVQDELARMESLGVISKVDTPTPWCAGMVVVPKKDKSVRICVDLKPLNTSVLRETHPLPRVDDTLAQLTGAKVFSKLDANSGFWQIPLAEKSRHLTTFLAPLGRFCFNKMPFGISSAPEHFQKRMNEILKDLPGVVCLIDDVLVYGSTEAEHDIHKHLQAVLEQIQSAGVTLNKEKCEFGKTTIKFLGHIITPEGISPDPHKTTAVKNMKQPSNVSELRRFLGMVNQLGKFSPNIAELTKPLRDLLSVKNSWMWGSSQTDAFNKVKDELTSPPVLAWYNPASETKITADASAYGLGAVLLQKHNNEWKPIAYASRSMTEAETRYAQIEKEALATTWACERFSNYILGKQVLLETDHKPLVPLFSTKHLDDLPPRILRFRLRLMQFDYTISHVPGKLLYTADTLSRSPQEYLGRDEYLAELTEEQMTTTTTNQFPTTTDSLETYRQAQREDPVCSQLMTFCQTQWPSKHNLPQELSKYWTARHHLTVCDKLLLYETRIVVPRRLQHETLCKIHKGHQGIERCRLRMSTSVWWPGASAQIEQFVKKCSICMKLAPPVREPMISSKLPKHPWERIATDLFEMNKQTYLLLVDYYSRYPEVIKLNSTTSTSVIAAMKSVFSRHGIPHTVISDNGPQYDSAEMKQFASTYGFNHITSSPYYPQSNGLAERVVKTIKSLLVETSDIYLALLSYRATPLPWCRLSPAELLMGRRLRTDVPQVANLLIPDWPHLQGFEEKDKEYKQQQKEHYDSRHRVRPVTPLPDDVDVWINVQGRDIAGRIDSRHPNPRSYVVNTPTGRVRRNRSQINRRLPESSSLPQSLQIPSQSESTRRPLTRLQTGTSIRPPDRLAYS